MPEESESYTIDLYMANTVLLHSLFFLDQEEI